MQSVYSTALADWATGYSLGKSYLSAEMQSVYSTALADWAIYIDSLKYVAKIDIKKRKERMRERQESRVVETTERKNTLIEMYMIKPKD